MAKVSVLIPARNEQFLAKTIDDLFAKAAGEIEVLAVLDGYWPDPPLVERSNLKIIHFGTSQGMRPAINAAARLATGDFFMKSDAHCMFDEGFDAKLVADCEDNWLVVPRRYSLDAEQWVIKTDRPCFDYHYLCYPFDKPNPGIHGVEWHARKHERHHLQLDDEMSSQGSCWFMSRRHFVEFLGGMRSEGYGQFVQEFQELGLKTWLGGGRVVINKKTWYAHLHKGKKYGRGYYLSAREMTAGIAFSTDYWMNDRWAERKYDLEWLLAKFWPVPTWPMDWRARHPKNGS